MFSIRKTVSVMFVLLFSTPVNLILTQNKLVQVQILRYRYSGTQVLRYIGTGTGTQVHWYRYSGTRALRYIGTVYVRILFCIMKLNDVSAQKSTQRCPGQSYTVNSALYRTAFNLTEPDPDSVESSKKIQ